METLPFNIIVVLQYVSKNEISQLMFHLGKIRVLLVCGRGLTGSDNTESAVPGRCECKVILKES